MGKSSIFFSLCILIIILSFFCGCIQDSHDDTPELINEINDTQLIGYWQFDKEKLQGTENEIIDSSGNDNHGTAFETTQIIPGRIGKGHVFFDGVDDYIIINNSEILQPIELTIETWIKKTSSNPFEYIISKGANNCDMSSYALYTDLNGGLSFYVSDGIDTFKSPNLNPSIWDGTWHHIAGSFDGQKCRLYVDGEEIQAGINNTLSINYSLPTHNNLYIGAFNGTCFLPFNGYIDELFIWNRVLNNSEIKNHFEIGESIGNFVDETQTSLSGLKEKIRLELSGLSQSDLLLIKGSDLSVQEEMLMFFAQQQLPDLNKIDTIYDKEITNISNLASSYQKVIFLGGNKTNLIIKSFAASDTIKLEEQYQSNPFLVSFGSSSYLDKNIIIFSTALESSTLTNKGPDRSPLSQIIDKRITPIAATIASITILQIANLFGSTISEFFFDFTSEKLGERKKRDHQFKKNRKSSRTIAYAREIGSIVIAIIIFSISLSWTWSTDFSHFFSLLLINLFVVSFFYIIREGLRAYYSKKYGLTTEHVFWPLGSCLTFISTILGNTFSLASYIALEDEENEKRYSKMYFTIFLLLFVLTLFTFFINIIFGSVIIQMFYVFTVMALFIDMTPIKPLDGYEVKKYNFKKWIILYIPVFIMYIIIMFSTIL